MLREIFVMTVSFFGAKVLYDIFGGVLTGSKTVRRIIKESQDLESAMEEKEEQPSRVMGFK